MNKGFTIIEMMVSIGIFMVVITMGMAATLGIMNANKKSQTSTLVMSNLSLAIEAMSKNLRVAAYDYDNENAYIYRVPSNRGDSITFIPSSGKGLVTYYLGGPQGASIMRETRDENNNIYDAAITAPDVIIEDLEFIVREKNNLHPSVVILVKGKTGGKEALDTKFYLQSLVSQRVIPSL